MKLNISHMAKQLEEKSKVKTLTKDNFGETYAYYVVHHSYRQEDIDFSLFSLEDVFDAIEKIEHAVTDEDMEGRLFLDPNHPLTKVVDLGLKMSGFEKVEKIRPSSPFPFI